MIYNLTKYPVHLHHKDGSSVMIHPHKRGHKFLNLTPSSITTDDGYVIPFRSHNFRCKISDTVIVDIDVLSVVSLECNVVLASKLVARIYTEAAFINVITESDIAAHQTKHFISTLKSLEYASTKVGMEMGLELDKGEYTQTQREVIVSSLLTDLTQRGDDTLIASVYENEFTKRYIKKALANGES